MNMKEKRTIKHWEDHHSPLPPLHPSPFHSFITATTNIRHTTAQINKTTEPPFFFLFAWYELECSVKILRFQMVPLVFHPEVMLDFVVVRHVHGDGRKSSVIIYYCPSSFCFNDNETEQHLTFQNGCYIRRCSSRVPPVNNEEPLMLLYKL